MKTDFIGAATIKQDYDTSVRTLDRAGIPSYRLTPNGKKLYRRSDIEAALTQNKSSVKSAGAHLTMIVDQVVEEILRGGAAAK